MNYFIYYTLGAMFYHVSKTSFMIANKWRDKEIFDELVGLFSLSQFKELKKEEKEVIYSKINELRLANLSKEEKLKWILVCKEQINCLSYDNLSLSRKKSKRNCQE